MKITPALLALAPLLAGCAATSAHYPDAVARSPAVLSPPGAGVSGPGTPRVHLQLEPPDSTLPEVELREVAGWEEKAFRTEGPMATMSGTRLVPGSQGICPIPCGAIIDGRGDREFFFGGPGIRPSSHFTLASEGGDVLIKVRPSSGVQWRAGETLTVVGAPLALFGTILLTATLADNPDSPAVPVTTVFLGTSAALLTAGIVMMATGGTKYSLQRLQSPRLRP